MHKTLKSNRNAVCWLPDDKYQLQVYKELSRDERQARVWSYNTRMHALSNGDMALVADIQSSDELMLINEHGTTQELIRALKVYTPGKETLIKMLRSWNVDRMAAAIAQVPSLFNALDIWHVFNKTADQFNAAGVEIHHYNWIFCRPLVEYYPHKWVVPFLEQLCRYNSEAVTQAGKEDLLRWLIETAVKNEVYFDRYIPTIIQKFGTGYSLLIRHNCQMTRAKISYFCAVMPLLDKHLQKKEAWNDSYAWLKMGSELIGVSDKIRNWFISMYNLLPVSFSESQIDEVYERLLNAADDGCIMAIYALRQDAKGRKRIISRFRGRLIHFFPFTEWEENLRLRALDELIQLKALPVKQLHRLSTADQKWVSYQLQANAQVQALLHTHDGGDFIWEHVPLLPEAEMFFLKTFSEEDIFNYLRKRGVGATGFSYLLTGGTRVRKVGQMLDLIGSKQGFTEAQYLELLGSQYAQHAPLLEKYVKKEGSGEEAEA